MKVIGLMSGTSADGIDAALYEIEGQPPQLQVQLLHGMTIPYSAELRQRILQACQPDTGTVDQICLLNFELGEAFADAILTLIQAAGITADEIDLIGSHGQTVWHNVRANGKVDATLQIVDGSVIAERTGITTINNFRTRDVAAGGQGAPLTSYIDWLLLRHETRWRAIQNIGGMGNVTLLPPLNQPHQQMVAFDTGPGNALMDAAAELLTGERFDLNGQMARRGIVDEMWLTELLEHPFFHRKPPKTTGRELFSTDMAHQLVKEGQARGLRVEDIMTILTMLTAQSIVDSYRNFAPAIPDEVILGGGGKHNQALVGMLQDLLPGAVIHTHEDLQIDSDFKEAMVFAILAYETWHDRPSTLPAQTGAAHPSVLGQITPGNNYVKLIQQTWCR